MLERLRTAIGHNQVDKVATAQFAVQGKVEDRHSSRMFIGSCRRIRVAQTS